MGNDEFALGKMFREANEGLEKYKHIIGIGVFVMLVTFSFLFMHALSEEKRMAEECGFDDGKIKCVCNSQAWESYIEYQAVKNNYGFTEDDFNNLSEDLFDGTTDFDR